MFLLVPHPVTYDESIVNCLGYGGQILTMASEEEFDFLKEKVASETIPT